MGKIHFYFFCLYNSFYKDGFYLENYLKTYRRVLPESRAILVLFISTYLWTHVIRITIALLIHPNFKMLYFGIYYELIISILIYGIYFYYFINKNRFIDIYTNFKSIEKDVQSRQVKKVYWFLALPLILIPLLCWLVSTFTNIDLTKC